MAGGERERDDRERDDRARPTLYTIGHSTHPVDELLRLLALHGIEAVGDVRSQPYSRFNPQYNREPLARSLRAADIAYVYLGRELGARVADKACLRDGRVEYERVARTELFRSGLERLRVGMETHRIALMCAERDPLTCHRMMLVTRNLRDDDLDVQHVRADGTVESNAAAELRLLDSLGMPRESLFQDENAMIEEAYARMGRRIAFAPRDATDARAPKGDRGDG